MREAFIEKYTVNLTDETEFLRAPNPEESLPVEVIDDDRLKCGTDTIRITPVVLALNGLLRCRKEQVDANAIRDAAGYDYSDSTFLSDTRLLNTQLTELTTIDPSVIVEGRARGKRYQLSPELDFIDRREDAKTDPELRRFYYGLSDDPPLLEAYKGNRIEFVSPNDRRRLLSDLLKEASSEPSVRWLGKELLNVKPHLLTKEERLANFTLIEQAIVAFAQSSERTPEQRRTITDGAMALQELFFSTFRSIQYFASKISEPAKGRNTDDLFQVGAIDVLEGIMTFDESEADENDQGYFFYNKMAMRASSAMRNFMEADRWRQLGVSERSVRAIRKVLKAQEDLHQHLQREPGPAEIAEHTGIDTEDVDRFLYYLNLRPVHVDANEDEDTDFSLSKFLFKNGHVIYSADRALELLHIQRDVLRVFLSSDLTTQEKIGLSIFFGVFVPHLAGEAFLRKTRSNDNAFMYPDDENTFLEITRACSHSPLHTGKIIQLDRDGTSRLIKRALGKAKEVLHED